MNLTDRIFKIPRGRVSYPCARWYARLRAVALILGGHETEICGRCGGKVGFVWRAPDEQWLAYSGFDGGHGCLCPSCFDLLARRAGFRPFWECGSLTTEFPTCTGQPCAHQESMLVIAAQRDRYWRELVAEREAADRLDSYIGRRAERDEGEA